MADGYHFQSLPAGGAGVPQPSPGDHAGVAPLGAEPYLFQFGGFPAEAQVAQSAGHWHGHTPLPGSAPGGTVPAAPPTSGTGIGFGVDPASTPGMQPTPAAPPLFKPPTIPGTENHGPTPFTPSALGSGSLGGFAAAAPAYPPTSGAAGYTSAGGFASTPFGVDGSVHGTLGRDSPSMTSYHPFPGSNPGHAASKPAQPMPAAAAAPAFPKQAMQPPGPSGKPQTVYVQAANGQLVPLPVSSGGMVLLPTGNGFYVQVAGTQPQSSASSAPGVAAMSGAGAQQAPAVMHPGTTPRGRAHSSHSTGRTTPGNDKDQSHTFKPMSSDASKPHIEPQGDAGEAVASPSPSTVHLRRDAIIEALRSYLKEGSGPVYDEVTATLMNARKHIIRRSRAARFSPSVSRPGKEGWVRLSSLGQAGVISSLKSVLDKLGGEVVDRCVAAGQVGGSGMNGPTPINAPVVRSGSPGSTISRQTPSPGRNGPTTPALDGPIENGQPPRVRAKLKLSHLLKALDWLEVRDVGTDAWVRPRPNHGAKPQDASFEGDTDAESISSSRSDRRQSLNSVDNGSMRGDGYHQPRGRPGFHGGRKAGFHGAGGRGAHHHYTRVSRNGPRSYRSTTPSSMAYHRAANGMAGPHQPHVSGEMEYMDEFRDDLSLGGETRASRTPVHFEEFDFRNSPPKGGQHSQGLTWHPTQDDLTDGGGSRGFLKSPIDGVQFPASYGGSTYMRDRGASVSSFESMLSERSSRVPNGDLTGGMKTSFGDEEDTPPGLFENGPTGKPLPSSSTRGPVSASDGLKVPGGPSVFSGLFTTPNENRTWAWQGMPAASAGLPPMAPWQLSQSSMGAH